MNHTLNSMGEQLARSLAQARQVRERDQTTRAHMPKVNVVGAGKALTVAYEQLRNAAANTEEHLLLQNAIKRFYRQLFITRDDRLVVRSGSELAVELTLAGYLANDTLTKDQVEAISESAVRHYAGYEKLQEKRGFSSERGLKWVLDSLAFETESRLNDHGRDTAFIDFAYQYLSEVLPTDKMDDGSVDIGAALFVAVHKALLKSDESTVRAALLKRYQISVDNLEEYISFNQQIDTLMADKTTDKLLRLVDRQGAPLRILRRMIENRNDIETLVQKRDQFLEAYEQQIVSEYDHITHRINRAIVRSVIFLVITKFLVGIAVEVPYDYLAYGLIHWQPLIINLLFPPLYMVALRLTHALPGYANTTALVDSADKMLYGDQTMLISAQINERRYGPIFSISYSLFSLAVFAAVVWGLLMLGFSPVHIVIFFIFISAASFLGFRLSRLIREIEVVRERQNGLTVVRDLIYLPFVVVGRWMSEKYSQVNLVTIVLDMLIELPLKTVLRLIRQWAAFIDDRKDRL